MKKGIEITLAIVSVFAVLNIDVDGASEGKYFPFPVPDKADGDLDGGVDDDDDDDDDDDSDNDNDDDDDDDSDNDVDEKEVSGSDFKKDFGDNEIGNNRDPLYARMSSNPTHSSNHINTTTFIRKLLN